MRILSLFPALFLFFCSASAQAQSSLDHFLDKIEEASTLPDCELTQNALNQITDAEFNAALDEIKTSKNQILLTKYREKISKIEKLTTKCPQVHDHFANKMSLLTVQARLIEKPADLDSIRAFVTWCENAANAESCQKSAETLAKFPEGMCEKAIIGFQSIQPSAFSDEEYNTIAEKLNAIAKWSASCADYKLVYDSCLIPKAANFQDISKLQPFFDFLHDLKSAISKTACSEISGIQIDTIRYQKAIDSISGLSPSQFSPSDRVKIRKEMHAVYEAAKSCPSAHNYIDGLIEKMFSGK